ncbi:Uncharacterised protein [Bordetella pertussis]|nr:Uncharacterised protein [Bordetella pertussis]
MGIVVELALGLVGVIAQEVHRFAHLGDGVGQRLAGLAHDQAEQRLHLLFQQLGRPPQALRALGHRRGLPDGRRVGGVAQGLLHMLRRGLHDVADDVAQVGRVGHFDRAGRIPAGISLAQHGPGAPVGRGAGQQGRRQRAQAMLVGQVQAGRVGPRALLHAAVQLARQGDFLVRRAQRHDAGRRLDRIGHQLLDRDAVVADQVDEGSVGAIFQQAAHQVRQQGFVRAHRGIDAARAVQLALRQRPDHLLVQRFAHAVQALELVLPRVVVLSRHLVDGRQGIGVMGGELRVCGLGRRQQPARAGQVGDVGVHLARVDRIPLQAVDLGALDLRVPIRPLDQAHHQAVAAALGQVDHVIDHERRALLIGLDDEADAIPVVQLGDETQGFQQVQRNLEPVGFLRVYVQADIVLARQQRQRLDARQQLGHDPVALGARITRMQRRQLDRDARAFVDAASGGRLADGMDGLLVRRVIAFGVGGRGRGLAQHVVRVAKAPRLHLAVVGQGLGDRLARDELLAHHAHGHVHALAHQRLAALADQARQRLGQRLLAADGDQLAGDHQAPGRGVDKQRLRSAHVRAPVAVHDLVADQGIAGGAVGNAQQRLGQAHQRHAFLAGQRELLDQSFDAAAAALGPQRVDQLAGHGVHLLGAGHAGLPQQQRHAFRLGPAIGGGDGGAQHGLRLHVLAELEERRHGIGRRACVLVLAALVAPQMGHFRRQMAAFDSVEIGKNGLLVQPVRGAVQFLRGGFEAIAQCVVDLDAQSRASHGMRASRDTVAGVMPAIRTAIQCPRSRRALAVEPYPKEVATRTVLRLTRAVPRCWA